MLASAELIKDFESAYNDGLTQVEEFFAQRIYSDIVSIYHTMHRNSRLNFAKAGTVKEISHVTSTKEMEIEGLGAVVSLLNASSLSEIFEYRITKECLTMFNPNGSFRKCQKSKLQQSMDIVGQNINSKYVAILDMGMFIRKAIPNQDKRFKEDGTDFTWRDYGESCVDMIFQRHSNASIIICVNDPYGREDSIKQHEERERRSDGVTSPNVHMKLDDKFPTNKEFTKILASDYNKSRIQNLLKDLLKQRQIISGMDIYYVLESCIDLADGSEIEELCCDHAEADTKMLTIYSQLRRNGLETPVVLDTEDTDVYVQSAYVAHTLPGLHIYRNTLERKYVDCQLLCSRELAMIIIQLHAMTGCDSNSAFFGHGKKKIIDNVKSNPEARNLLKPCGESLELTRSTVDDLTKFVIRYIYNDRKSSTPTEARVKKYKSFKKKKSLSRLPPDNDSLKFHIKRANYLAFIQLQYSLKDHPTPIGNGWHLVNGKCYAERYSNDVHVPREILHGAEESGSESDSTNMSSSDETESDSDES